MREFVGARGRARLLTAACDDLVTPRTLGPLCDARWRRPLARACERDVFGAVMEELARERPTVLVIEDAHWADDATLDVLGYAARRVGSLGALLVLTVRDEALQPGHPLQRLLGMLAGEPVHRLELAPLSRAAVGALAEGTGRDPEAVHALTRGNPFFVAEALAASPEEVPASVKDAVLARLRQVSADCRDAVERLSVVPSLVPDALATGCSATAGGADRGRARGAGRGAAGRHRVPARARAAGDRAAHAGDPAAAAQPRGRGARLAGVPARGCCTTRPRRGTWTRSSPRARRRRARRRGRARTGRRSRTSRR